MRRVAVTGLGVVSPLGNDPETFFAGLVAGRRGVRRLEGPGFERLGVRVGAPADFDGEKHFAPARARMLDRVSQLALFAASQAVVASQGALGNVDRRRAGVFMGTGMGGSQTTDEGYRTLYAEGSDRLKPFSVLMAMNNAAASWIGLDHQLEGPNLTYSTACSSSAVAIGEAARRVASGEADVMLAGGAEAPLTLGTIKAWEALKTLAAEDADAGASCRPFSKDRGGLVLGEGAAVVVLEDWERARARGAPILAESAGYGLFTDNAHITRPSVEGQAEAIRRALGDAGLDARDVGYINAHGTGTLANDGVETAAIKSVFGEERARATPVSSTKSMHGHLLGAAGALEFIATVMALARETLPPTMNLRVPDPECDLDYVPNEARAGDGRRAALTNSFAFGGTNVVLAVRR